MAGAAGAAVETETAPVASQADSASGASTSSPGAAVKETGGGNATGSATAGSATTTTTTGTADVNTKKASEEQAARQMSTVGGQDAVDRFAAHPTVQKENAILRGEADTYDNIRLSPAQTAGLEVGQLLRKPCGTLAVIVHVMTTHGQVSLSFVAYNC